MIPRLRPLHALERFGRRVLHARGLRSRWVETDMGRLHAYDGPGFGSLPPVVVVHGIGSSATSFAALLIQLRRGFSRVIAVEMPGHGFSEAPRATLDPDALMNAMTQALDRLTEGPFVLCGNSLGGAVALHYAVTRPERLRGLVLLSPAGARMTTEELTAVLDIFRIDTRRKARDFFARLYHRPPWFAPLFARDFMDIVAGRAVRDLLATTSVDHLADPERVRALGVPTLLVWGRSERLLPATGLTFFREHLPKTSVIEEPEGFGHCPHLDDPRGLAARMITFARTL